MAPRPAGGLVLLAVLLVVITGHVATRQPLVGSATAMTIAGPPRVGDCVIAAPDPPIDPDILRVPVTFGPCTGPVAGEIVTVAVGRPSRPDGAIGVLMGTAGPCWAAASR